MPSAPSGRARPSSSSHGAACSIGIIRRLASIDIPPDTGDFRLIDRKVVLALRQVREHHRFMRGLSVWVGFRQTGIRYDAARALRGQPRNIRWARWSSSPRDAITGFSYVPLQLATTLGFWVSGVALVAIPVVAVLRVIYNEDFFFGQATTLIAVLFLGGVQLIFLGTPGRVPGPDLR